MAMGSRALNVENLSGGHQRFTFEQAAQTGDLGGRPVREIGKCAF
jgi:hypothetical protein